MNPIMPTPGSGGPGPFQLTAGLCAGRGRGLHLVLGEQRQRAKRDAHQAERASFLNTHSSIAGCWWGLERFFVFGDEVDEQAVWQGNLIW